MKSDIQSTYSDIKSTFFADPLKLMEALGIVASKDRILSCERSLYVK